MTTLDGRKFSLAEAEKSHTAVVVLFISTICPYSNYYNDLMRDMSADFKKKGMAFVGINSGTLETAEEARVHAREHGHTFDIIKDPESQVAELLDARRTPEAYLLDSSGTLRYRGRIASNLGSGPPGGDRGRSRRAPRASGDDQGLRLRDRPALGASQARFHSCPNPSTNPSITASFEALLVYCLSCKRPRSNTN